MDTNNTLELIMRKTEVRDLRITNGRKNGWQKDRILEFSTIRRNGREEEISGYPNQAL